eukprot:CFRG3804T1
MEDHGKLVPNTGGGIPYMELTVGFMAITFLWEMYLHIRQHRKFNEKNLPDSLVGTVDKDQFEKARKYGYDKSVFNFFRQWWDVIETTLIIMLGGLPFIWEMSGSILESFGLMANENEILQSLLFIYIAQAYQLVTTLPWNLYYTFVLEERHGMNNQTFRFYAIDQAKSLVLTMTVVPLLLTPILYLIMWTGEYFYVYVWAFVFAFSIASITIYSDYIAPMFDRFEPLPESTLRDKITSLAKSLAFPATQLLVVYASNRSSHSNAYFIGFFNNKKIVLFDTLFKKHEKKNYAKIDEAVREVLPKDKKGGIAEANGCLVENEPLFDNEGNVTGKRNCNDEEVLAILAHELGHWKLNHTLKMFAFNQVVVFVTFMLFGMLIHNAGLYASFGFESTPTIIGLILIMQFVFAPINVAVGFAFTVVTRIREYEADEFAVQLGHGNNLKSALIKLQVDNLGNMNPDPWYSTYHYSHPPLVERLAAIERAMAETKKTR